MLHVPALTAFDFKSYLCKQHTAKATSGYAKVGDYHSTENENCITENKKLQDFLKYRHALWRLVNSYKISFSRTIQSQVTEFSTSHLETNRIINKHISRKMGILTANN